MTTVLIVVHLMIILAMIGLVLLQRSEGGALGIGGGQGAFLTGRGAGNVLTRTTGILAVAFFATSLGLALLAKYQSRPSDILENLPAAQTAPTDTPAEAPGGQITTEDLLREFGSGTSGPQQPPATETTDAPAARNTAPAASPTPDSDAPSAPATGGPQAPPEPESGQN
jgi:preprotein translocase subunit SecG